MPGKAAQPHLFAIALLLLVLGLTALAAIPPLRFTAQQAEPPAVLYAVFPPARSARQGNRAIVEAGAIPLRNVMGGVAWTFIATDNEHARRVESQGAIVLALPGRASVLPVCGAGASRVY